MTLPLVEIPESYTMHSNFFDYDKFNKFSKFKIIAFPNGVVYRGITNDHGRAHGLGVEVKENSIYEGRWNNGLKCGEGYEKNLTTGDIYRGTFARGVRHGIG